jgi:hypothetical protein
LRAMICSPKTSHAERLLKNCEFEIQPMQKKPLREPAP